MLETVRVGPLGSTPSSVALVSSANPAVFGRPVTVTASVSPSSATGSVTFYDGLSVLGISKLTSGQATVTTSLLESGAQSLKAFYTGDGSYAASHSAALTQTVYTVVGDGFLTAGSFTTGTNPTYMAVGDFNGDGKVDIAAPTVSGNVSILLGNGDGTFQTAVNYHTGSYPYSVAVGDFNGDGKPDLAVADLIDNTVGIMLGNGDGTFQSPAYYSTGPYAEIVVVGDFNGDGRADLAVANSTGVNVFLGNGDGTFQTALTSTVASSPTALAVGDFNGDGKADLAVANAGTYGVLVLLGNGDGTFDTGGLYATGSDARYVTAYDFNGDGRTDLAVANVITDNVSVLLGNGDGTFQAAVNYAAGSGPQCLALGDFNGDGIADLVTANLGYALPSTTVSVLLGNANGTFQPAVNYGVSVAPYSVVVADFNGDGRADIAAANSVGNKLNAITVLVGHYWAPTTATLSSSANPSTFGQKVSLTATISSSSATGTVAFYDGVNILGTQPLAGGVATLTTSLLTSGAHKFKASYSGDIAFLASSSASLAQTVVTVAETTLQAPVNYGAGNPVFVAVGDFNGDGNADLVTADGYSGTVSILLGNGDGTFRTPVSYGAGSPFSVAVGDFNKDGKPDLVVANEEGGLGVLLGNGDGTFQSYVHYSINEFCASLAVGDFNGDANLDVAALNFSGGEDGTGSVAIFLGNGNGTLQGAMYNQVGSYPVYVGVGDFNGDGHADLAVVNNNYGAAGSVSILLGNGNGTFQAPENYYTVGNGPQSLAMADFNGDGNVDLAVLNSSGNNVTILLGKGDGTFQSGVLFGAGADPVSIAVGDFNGDGKPDLAIASPGSDYVGLYMGNGDGTFQNPVIYVIGAVSLAVADFNGDGRADLAIAGKGVSVMLGTGPTIASTVSVSGQATVSGVGLSGVTINVTGSQTTSTTTNSSGNYSVSLWSGGTYTLTPVLSGYSFSAPVTFSNLSSNQTANFSGVVVTNDCVGMFSSATGLTCSPMSQGAFQGNLAVSIGAQTTYYGAMTLVGDAPFGDAAGIALYNAGGGFGASVSLDLYNTASNGGTPQAKIKATDDGNYSDSLTIWTKTPGGPNNGVTEKLRITSTGNVGIGTTNPTLGPLQMGSGAYVSPGGVWTNASDRKLKENFVPLVPSAILQKIDALPLLEWNYIDEDPSVRHIGPIAQDFFSIFGVGDSSTSISTIDPSGIALAGIQGLDQKSQGRAVRLAELKKQMDAKTEELRALKERLNRLESLLQQNTP